MARLYYSPYLDIQPAQEPSTYLLHTAPLSLITQSRLNSFCSNSFSFSEYVWTSLDALTVVSPHVHFFNYIFTCVSCHLSRNFYVFTVFPSDHFPSSVVEFWLDKRVGRCIDSDSEQCEGLVCMYTVPNCKYSQTPSPPSSLESPNFSQRTSVFRFLVRRHIPSFSRQSFAWAFVFLYLRRYPRSDFKATGGTAELSRCKYIMIHVRLVEIR